MNWKSKWIFAGGLLAAALLTMEFGYGPRAVHAQPKKKRILAIGQTKGFQHDAVSLALAQIVDMGRENGLWETIVKTDAQLITKKKLGNNAKNLDYFDAVYFYTTGELDLDDEQKAALLSFVKEDGKGFVGGHSSIDTNYQWPEYGELTGGYFDSHPWNTFEAPIINEDQSHPITAHFPKAFTIYDEIYQAKSWSRDKVHVLMRLDDSKLDMTRPNIKRTDKDFAVAWTKSYGKGRVFYSTFGHHDQSLARPDVRKMYEEAIKWALRLTEGDTTPHARPAN